MRFQTLLNELNSKEAKLLARIKAGIKEYDNNNEVPQRDVLDTGADMAIAKSLVQKGLIKWDKRDDGWISLV